MYAVVAGVWAFTPKPACGLITPLPPFNPIDERAVVNTKSLFRGLSRCGYGGESFAIYPSKTEKTS